MKKTPAELQAEIKDLKANIARYKKEIKALRENFDQLVTDAKLAKKYLDTHEGGAAWEVLDDSLTSIGRN